MNSQLKYYQINSLYVDKTLPTLVDENNLTHDLEQKVWLLILLFCQRPQEIITRDEIISDVYHGIVVSDNAVNKLVAKVRKILGDTPTEAKYIKTVPKQGYSLIANIAEVDKVGQPVSDTSVTNYSSFRLIALAAVVTSVLLIFMYRPSTQEQYINQKLSPLTRSVGVETSPYLSDDGKYLIYQKSSPQHDLDGWWINKVSNEGAERSLSILNQRSPITWLPDRHSFLYTERDQSRCEVRKMSVTEDSLSSSLVMDCGEFWLSQLASAKDGSGFYFVARKQVDEPWLVYFYSFVDKLSMAIKQPSTSGFGNYAINLSPDGKKLLFLSSELEGKTTFHVLNLSENELEKKGQRDWMLFHAIWHHDNKRILHTTQLYARELLLTNFKGDSESTLISTSKRVSDNFKRHPNGVDFYFTSFQMNNDLLSFNNGKVSDKPALNSEVYEKFPTFNGINSNWYFVSNRQGISQIFLSTENGSTQVSDFKIEYHFIGFQSSVNGKALAFYDAKYIYVYDTESNTLRQYETPRGVVSALSWLDNDSLAVSTLAEAITQVYTFNLSEEKYKPLENRWQVVFSAPDSERIFAVETRTNKLFLIDERFEAIEEVGLTIDNPVGFNGLQIKAIQNSLIYAKPHGMKTSIYKFNLQTKQERKLGEWLFVVGFDVRGEQLILSYEKSRAGDVMRTHLMEIN